MQEKNLNKKTTKPLMIGTGLMFIAIILIVWFFMYGETRISGEWTAERTDFLTCEATGIEYPFFNFDNSREKTIKINLTFKDENIKTTSLIYTLEYNDEKSIIDSENFNHIAMNKKFATDNLGFDALGLKFSKFSSGLQMGLFVDSDKFDDRIAKYFMLDEIKSISPIEIRKEYEMQGFICQRNN